MCFYLLMDMCLPWESSLEGRTVTTEESVLWRPDVKQVSQLLCFFLLPGLERDHSLPNCKAIVKAL